ncbi:MAG: AmmeMemoRadiSam system radical SAM enzyme [Syntrophales bacterium]|nr:AmmeMemoRadiSam system radical SAM enzyme [Syntrophales bacterium]
MKDGLTRRDFFKCCILGLTGTGLATYVDTIFMFTVSPALAAGPNKYSREALFYEKTSTGALKCRKCPHECVLKENSLGLCRNRMNYEGKLYTIAYGNPCAVHIDPIEKKPFFHFLPGTRSFSIATAGCNLRCLSCQNWQISQFSPLDTYNVDLPPEKVVEESASSRCASIAYTYSEPTTFYEYTYDTAKIARGKGIKNVIKSSGYINEIPLKYLAKVIDAANIDLKCFDDNIYRKLSSVRLEPVLNTLKILKNEGVWLEITNLIVPEWTDNMDMIKRMCEWLSGNGLSECPLHFTRFSPMFKLTHLPLTPISTLEKAREIAINSGIKYVYIGNVPGHPGENTYCHHCKRLIIERKGFRILNNNVLKGKCRHCHTAIPGVFFT